ncbi:MAG: cyclic peptide export ABC transporter [Jaaginema sp. PMC 1079.18]|nr:cyclic peptide export ABC transporter [Jaaginema sp. PMC 1080.18]MEC4850960.1 cyclic peptide export ABC transporter [Jaaginema sp. PMC 1079.18]MEC4867775.1 cyclic peptide export ABC transporter [Jaaginema sp. PMC 1078.18]
MKLLAFLFKSSWQMVAVAIAMGFVSGGSSAGLIALISWLVGEGKIPPSPAIAWAFFGLALLALCASIVARVMLIHLSQNAVYRLQMRLSRQILAAELSQLETLGSPRLLATLTEDVQTISNAVFVLPFVFINIAIVMGGLLYITWLSWQVFLMVVGLSAIATFSVRISLGKGRSLLALAREEQDQLFQHFRSITEGIKELKLHAQRRQDFLEKNLQPTATQYRRHNVKGLTLFATTDSWGKLIFFFAIGLVLFILPYWLEINTTTLSGYVLTFTYLVGPLENIVNKLPLIAKANVALEKINTLGFSLKNKAENIDPSWQKSQNWQRLDFQNVTHTYYNPQDDTQFTLGPLNLTFEPGKIVFIIGGNGSGKSTFAKIITGLYPPDAGIIYLDNQPITEDNREAYRQYFSAIFSDFYLFEKLLGFDRKSQIPAQEYLKKLQLEQKVTLKDGSLSTLALSQGQRKRLALLTAYLEDRPIYLFDEWAADQDPNFKDLFYTQILPELRAKGKTVFAISHDDRYFDQGDRVIKLDYGQIAEDYS